MISEELQILSDLHALDFYRPEKVVILKSEAMSLIDAADRVGAAAAVRKLGPLIRALEPSQNPDEISSMAAARVWLMRLKVFAFSALNPEEKEDLLKNDLPQIMINGFDLKYEVNRYLDLYSEITGQAEKKIFADLVTKSVARFADRSVSDWIKTYLASARRDKPVGMALSAYDVVTFINEHQDVKGLQEQDRKALREILSFYNWITTRFISESVETTEEMTEGRGVDHHLSVEGMKIVRGVKKTPPLPQVPHPPSVGKIMSPPPRPQAAPQPPARKAIPIPRREPSPGKVQQKMIEVLKRPSSDVNEARKSEMIKSLFAEKSLSQAAAPKPLSQPPTPTKQKSEDVANQQEGHTIGQSNFSVNEALAHAGSKKVPSKVEPPKSDKFDSPNSGSALTQNNPQ